MHGELGDTAFSGYEATHGEATVKALVVEGQRVEAALAGTTVAVVLDRTPMYGESGGQVGDTGIVEADGVEVRIDDTLKPVAGLFVHRGHVVREARGR